MDLFWFVMAVLLAWNFGFGLTLLFVDHLTDWITENFVLAAVLLWPVMLPGLCLYRILGGR